MKESIQCYQKMITNIFYEADSILNEIALDKALKKKIMVRKSISESHSHHWLMFFFK